MKKFVVIAAILAFGGFQAYKHYYSDAWQALDAYKQYDTSKEVAKHQMLTKRVGLTTGGLVEKMSHSLESHDKEEGGIIYLTVFRTKQVDYGGVQPLVSRARHYVTMENIDGVWEVVEVDEEPLDRKGNPLK
jgi:hypothetical protein